jgi:hypothetical protein
MGILWYNNIVRNIKIKYYGGNKMKKKLMVLIIIKGENLNIKFKKILNKNLLKHILKYFLYILYLIFIFKN